MKIASLILGFCLITTFAFADSSAEIISYDKDSSGNIKLKGSAPSIKLRSHCLKVETKVIHYVLSTKLT